MKVTSFICDKCGEQINGVVYTLTCYASDANPAPWGLSEEAGAQNMAQNMAKEIRHLCKACKNKITDGVFVV